MKITMADIRAQVEEGQKKWARGINIQSDDIDITDINDFVRFKTLEYEDANLKDDELWGLYQDDFKDFTVEIFKNCNQTHVRKLRMILQTNGVWVQKHRNTTVPESLFDTIQEEDPTDWTISEINEHMAAGGKFNSGRIEYILKNNTADKDSTDTETMTTGMEGQEQAQVDSISQGLGQTWQRCTWRTTSTVEKMTTLISSSLFSMTFATELTSHRKPEPKPTLQCFAV